MSTSIEVPTPRAAAAAAAPTGPAPAGMPRGVMILVGTAAAVITVAGLQLAAWLVAPILLALVVVIAVSPIQGLMHRKGFPAWSSVLVLVVVIFGTIVALVGVLLASVGQLVALLPQYADRIQALGASLSSALARVGFDPTQARSTAGSVDLGKVAGAVGSVLSDLSGALSSLVFILALLLFLTAEASGAGRRLQAIGLERPHMVTALNGFARGTRRYLVVTAIFGLIVAVLDAAALALLGIPLVVLWGLLSFITNFIPNIGFIIGVIPPALLGLLVGGWQLMLAVLVVYLVLNALVQSLIQPRFTGDAVGLSTVVTFVALLFWAWILGPLGALLAIPATLLVKAILVDCDPGARWVEALIGAAGSTDSTDSTGSTGESRTEPEQQPAPEADPVPVQTIPDSARHAEPAP